MGDNSSGRESLLAAPRCPYCEKELVVSGAFLVCPRPFATARCEVYAKRRNDDTRCPDCGGWRGFAGREERCECRG